MQVGIDEAIAYLEQLEQKLLDFPTQVAMDSVNRIDYPNVMADTTAQGTTRIVAMGDQIAFEEFGAGFEADTFDYDAFHTEPGIWSEDHARTFQNYNGEPENYRYNRTPKHALRDEAKRLPDEIMNKAREVFNDNKK